MSGLQVKEVLVKNHFNVSYAADIDKYNNNKNKIKWRVALI